MLRNSICTEISALGVRGIHKSLYCGRSARQFTQGGVFRVRLSLGRRQQQILLAVRLVEMAILGISVFQNTLSH